MMRKYLIADISEHNNVVNYDAMASNCHGVMLRASLGAKPPADVYRIDKKFRTHAKELTKRGIPIGAYHYSYARTVDEARTEAKGFLKVIKSLEAEGIYFTLPLAFDMEDNHYNGQSDHGNATRSDLAQMCYVFCEEVEKAGYFSILYASGSWLREFYRDHPQLGRFGKWCAHWNVSKPMVDCLLWQFTVSPEGSKYGQNGGRIDLNTTDIDFPSLITKNGLNGLQSPKTAPRKYSDEFVTMGENTYYFDKLGKLLPFGIYLLHGAYYLIAGDGSVVREGSIRISSNGQLVL